MRQLILGVQMRAHKQRVDRVADQVVTQPEGVHRDRVAQEGEGRGVAAREGGEVRRGEEEGDEAGQEAPSRGGDEQRQAQEGGCYRACGPLRSERAKKKKGEPQSPRWELTVSDVARPVGPEQLRRLPRSSPEPFARHPRITQRVRIKECGIARQARQERGEPRDEERSEGGREVGGLDEAPERVDEGGEGGEDGDEEGRGDDGPQGWTGRAGCRA